MRNRKNIIILLAGCFLSILLGWTLKDLDILSGIALLIVAGTLLFFTVLTAILDLINKTRYFVVPGGAFASVAFGMYLTSVFHGFENDKKQEIAKQIVQEIYQYQDTHGEYPETLQNIQSATLLPELDYYRDTTKNYFEISYPTSSWHTNHYLSNEDEWMEIGR